jgi:tetratricopeptide (TPR) repeat protein
MIEDLLRDGSSYHNTASARFAGELEAAVCGSVDPGSLVPLLYWSNHTIGEHLGDWPRARALAERALDGRTPDARTAAAWAKLYAARAMAGDLEGAEQAQQVYAATDGIDPRVAAIDSKMTLANALAGSGRLAEGSALYESALGLARNTPKSNADRMVAIASNNLASQLLEVCPRSAEQDELMRAAAAAGLEFWLRCGTWQNEERALYLSALVANALGEPMAAREAVDAAFRIIDANGSEPVDETFLRLARANAFAMLGDLAGHKRDLAAAESAAASWDGAMRQWFAEERAKIKLL